MLASLMIFGVVMPRLQRLWVADRAARVTESVAEPALPALVVGYHEPSLVFLLGTRTRFVDAKSAVAALEAHQSSVAIVASTSASELVRLAHARGVDLQEIARIEGIDPVHGRPIELGVWKSGSVSERPTEGEASESCRRSVERGWESNSREQRCDIGRGLRLSSRPARW